MSVNPVTPNADTAPAPGLNPLKTASDWRDLLHRVVTAVLVVLGTAQFAFADPKAILVAVIVPGLLGIIDAAISFSKSNDGGRRVVYAVLGLGQAVVQFIGYATNSWQVVVVGIAAAVVNSVYASQFTATSAVSGTGRHARPE
jgi:hypothetical protein